MLPCEDPIQLERLIELQVGGRWLGWMVVAAAMVSQVGQFEAEMSTDSYLLHGMAERGFLPAIFAHKSKHGTPSLAIACSALGVIGMARYVRQMVVAPGMNNDWILRDRVSAINPSHVLSFSLFAAFINLQLQLLGDCRAFECCLLHVHAAGVCSFHMAACQVSEMVSE